MYVYIYAYMYMCEHMYYMLYVGVSRWSGRAQVRRRVEQVPSSSHSSPASPMKNNRIFEFRFFVLLANG